MIYRQHEKPGCGGCLLFLVLFLLLVGGTPLLLQFFGFILFAGLALFLMLGAGFWAFSYYVKRQVSNYERSQSESHNLFVYLLVNILTQVASSDGEVSGSELSTILSFFKTRLHYSQSQIMWVRELCKEAIQNRIPLDQLLLQFRENFAYEPRLILLDLIYQVVYSQTPVLEKAKELARHIAEFLQISSYDQQSIRSRYAYAGRAGAPTYGAVNDHHFDTLGLKPGASWEEIKKAYRALSMRYHPDKVNHLGDEFKQVAEDKMKDLNVAYQALKEKYAS